MKHGEIWSTYPFIDNLQTIKLPDNLKYIHKYAFWRQRGLRIVYMTRNVLTNIGYGVPPFALGSNFNNFDGPNDDYNYQALGQPFYTDETNYPIEAVHTTTGWLQSVAYSNEEIKPMHIEGSASGHHPGNTYPTYGTGSASEGFFNSLEGSVNGINNRDNYEVYLLEKKNNDAFYGSHGDMYNRNDGWITQKGGNVVAEPQPSTESITNNVGTTTIFTDIDGNTYSHLISGEFTLSDYQNYVAKENIKCNYWFSSNRYIG